MKRFLRAGLLAILLAAAALSGQQTTSGQQARNAPGNSPLKPLAFLSGRWTSESGTEVQEENWSPIIGSSMTGSFRVVESGTAVFYEFWAVEVDSERPVLKLKHFNAGLAGWEEKDASTKMPLISSTDNDAVFTEADGSVSLHYRRAGDKLTCTVHHVRNGKASDEVFNFTRAPGN